VEEDRILHCTRVRFAFYGLFLNGFLGLLSIIMLSFRNLIHRRTLFKGTLFICYHGNSHGKMVFFLAEILDLFRTSKQFGSLRIRFMSIFVVGPTRLEKTFAFGSFLWRFRHIFQECHTSVPTASLESGEFLKF
jgi:hypothetical protein